MKSLNGQNKLTNGQSETGWTAMAHRGYTKWIKTKILGISAEREVYTYVDAVKIIG